MLFSDLLYCPYNNRTDLIDEEYLKKILWKVPKSVIKQFYSDHGRKYDFQKIYKDLDIDKLQWKEIELTALELMNCKYNVNFSEWVNNVANRINSFDNQGWECIVPNRNEYSIKIVNHWKAYNTWIESPIFIDGKIISSDIDLWLVEWHTRTWILIGLIENWIIAKDSKHKICYWKY